MQLPHEGLENTMQMRLDRMCGNLERKASKRLYVERLLQNRLRGARERGDGFRSRDGLYRGRRLLRASFIHEQAERKEGG